MIKALLIVGLLALFAGAILLVLMLRVIAAMGAEEDELHRKAEADELLHRDS